MFRKQIMGFSVNRAEPKRISGCSTGNASGSQMTFETPARAELTLLLSPGRHRVAGQGTRPEDKAGDTAKD